MDIEFGRKLIHGREKTGAKPDITRGVKPSELEPHALLEILGNNWEVQRLNESLLYILREGEGRWKSFSIGEGGIWLREHREGGVSDQQPIVRLPDVSIVAIRPLTSRGKTLIAKSGGKLSFRMWKEDSVLKGELFMQGKELFDQRTLSITPFPL